MHVNNCFGISLGCGNVKILCFQGNKRRTDGPGLWIGLLYFAWSWDMCDDYTDDGSCGLGTWAFAILSLLVHHIQFRHLVTFLHLLHLHRSHEFLLPPLSAQDSSKPESNLPFFFATITGKHGLETLVRFRIGQNVGRAHLPRVPSDSFLACPLLVTTNFPVSLRSRARLTRRL